jgi:hypothetical protein
MKKLGIYALVIFAFIVHINTDCLSFGKKQYPKAQYYAQMYMVTIPREVEFLKAIEANDTQTINGLFLNELYTQELSKNVTNAAYRLAESMGNRKLMQNIWAAKRKM